MEKLTSHYQLYINGEWRSGSKGQIMHSENPHNNKPWASFDCAISLVSRIIILISGRLKAIMTDANP